MQAHIAELIEQHRRTDELDDASFGRVIQLFYKAQIACTAERYEEAAGDLCNHPRWQIEPQFIAMRMTTRSGCRRGPGEGLPPGSSNRLSRLSEPA
jgi:hypothetical protein